MSHLPAEPAEVQRRTVLRSAALVPAVAVTAPWIWQDFFGSALILNADLPVHIGVRAVSATKVSVVAQVRSATEPQPQELIVRVGASVFRQRFTDGLAVLGADVGANTKTSVLVGVTGSHPNRLTADTSTQAQRASLHRVVNKRIRLGEDDRPKKLVVGERVMVDERVAKPLEAMLKAADKAGAGLVTVSGFRDYAGQKHIYDHYKESVGQEKADRYSARPGHSEHQLGLALDVAMKIGSRDLNEAFGRSKPGIWLAAHAHEYGFIIRYPKGQTHVTGYQPEPWHIRYVGKETARFMHARKDIPTLEKLFGLPDAPDYA